MRDVYLNYAAIMRVKNLNYAGFMRELCLNYAIIMRGYYVLIVQLLYMAF